jgi:hypothetical protein
MGCGILKCPEWRAVSGFAVPKKHSQKANDFIGSTPKPDRITEGQKGWNLEPFKSRFSGHRRATATGLQPRRRAL